MSTISADDRFWSKLAIGAWILFAGIIVIDCAQWPFHAYAPKNIERTVTDNYRGAAMLWRQRADLYTPGPDGFLYFPQSAILWVPFTLPPLRVGELLWRTLCLGLFASAVYRLARVGWGDEVKSGEVVVPRVSAEPWPIMFLVMTVLCIAPGAGSTRNGQMNIPIAALLGHATVDITQARWWRSAALLVLSLGLKPIVLPAILLAAALRPKELLPRLILICVALAALPFATAPPGYVLRQYENCIEKLRASADGVGGRWNDFAGILRTLSFEPPGALMLAVRGLAAAVSFGAVVVVSRRFNAARAAVVLLTLSAVYMTAFNPRAEANTYVIVAVPLAYLACRALFETRERGVGVALLLAAVGNGFSRTLLGGNQWLRPAIGLAVFGFVVVEVLRSRGKKASPGHT